MSKKTHIFTSCTGAKTCRQLRLVDPPIVVVGGQAAANDIECLRCRKMWLILHQYEFIDPEVRRKQEEINQAEIKEYFRRFDLPLAGKSERHVRGWLIYALSAEGTREAEELTVEMPGRYQQRKMLVKLQDGRCAGCNNGRTELIIDHDHKSGLTRGLLCRSCNTEEGCGSRRLEEYRQNPPAKGFGWVYQDLWGNWAQPAPDEESPEWISRRQAAWRAMDEAGL